MSCSLCGKEKKLIKAHAIPEAFFRLLRKGETPPKLMTNIAGIYPKKAPIGVYDTGILCEECEKGFQEWDDYAIRVLVNELDTFKPISDGQKTVAYYLEKYDYKKLKLFFISVLWRASVSTQVFYEKVNLGPWEDAAKNHILNENPGSEHEFSTLLSLFISKAGRDKLARTMMDPYRERWEHVNAYRVYFAGIVAYIKVDKRQLPNSLSKLMLKDANPLHIVCRDLESSNDVNAMIAVVKGGHN